jgi:hypothetical protein
MDDLASPSVIRDPYPLYAELRGAQVMREGAGIDGWLVSRYHDVRRVLTDAEAFGSPPNRLGDRFQFASTVSKAAMELRRAEIEAAIVAHLDRLMDTIQKYLSLVAPSDGAVQGTTGGAAGDGASVGGTGAADAQGGSMAPREADDRRAGGSSDVGDGSSSGAAPATGDRP